MPSSSKQAKQPTSTKEKAQAANKVSGPGKARTKSEYTLDELAGMFSSEDWEELYAFVDIIDGVAGNEDEEAAWSAWAENQGKRTAEEWRQYFEKVVRPQWLRDPVWKREQIRKKREKKHSKVNETEQMAASASGASQEKEKASEVHKPSESEDERFEQLLKRRRKDQTSAAYTYFAREKKWETWNAQPGLSYSE